MPKKNKSRNDFDLQIRREQTRIKRAIFKLVRANPGVMNTIKLISIVRQQSKVWTSEPLIAGVIWKMVDYGELILLRNYRLNLGPHAPQLRKK